LNSNYFANYKQIWKKRKGIFKYQTGSGPKPSHRPSPTPAYSPRSGQLRLHCAARSAQPTYPFFRPRAAQRRPSKPAPRPSSNARVAAQRPRSERLWSRVRNELVTDRVHPFPNSLRSDVICFQLEIEPRSSPRPLRVDGFSPINRWPWRRNLPRIESNPRTRSKRRGHQIRRLPKQLDLEGA
jgi:hypothetical protein